MRQAADMMRVLCGSITSTAHSPSCTLPSISSCRSVTSVSSSSGRDCLCLMRSTGGASLRPRQAQHGNCNHCNLRPRQLLCEYACLQPASDLICLGQLSTGRHELDMHMCINYIM